MRMWGGEGREKKVPFWLHLHGRASPIIRQKFSKQLLHSSSHHDLCISWAEEDEPCKLQIGSFVLWPGIIRCRFFFSPFVFPQNSKRSFQKKTTAKGVVGREMPCIGAHLVGRVRERIKQPIEAPFSAICSKRERSWAEKCKYTRAHVKGY